MNERILIGDDIVVTVVEINQGGSAVKIGIDAPSDISIDRQEVRDSKNSTKGLIDAK